MVTLSVLAIVCLFGLQSFGNDGGTSPTIQVDSVCFSRDILPMLNSNCAMSNCHDAISHKEGLILTSYAGIVKGVKPGSSATSGIYKQIANNKMPEAPYTKLTAAQKTLVQTWIDQGAKNTTCEVTNCDSVNVTFSTVKSIIVNNCLGCHNGASAFAGIDFSTDQMIEDTKDLILCTAIHASYCKPMPFNGLSLTSCEKGIINRWATATSAGNIQLGEPVVQSYSIAPNIVKDAAVIQFQLEKRQMITMSLYGYDGRKIRTISGGEYSAGQHEVPFSAYDLSRGAYFVRIQAGNSIQSLMFTH
ncbi:MAG: hypothetical protein HYZ54_02210 [Ignavibacteriae bacterium]|nr:hypothetical protein [Ignavibacteriota bacterium]